MLKIKKQGKSQIKSRNKLRVFKTILKEETITRTQLEKELNLSAPSVSRVVESLLKAGLVVEVGTEQTHVGRRPVKLEVNKNAYYSIGINITKTKLYLCINNLSNEIIYKNQEDINAIHDNSKLLEVIDFCIVKGLKQAGIDAKDLIGIGVASRGIIDYEKGMIVKLKEGLNNIDMCKHLKKQYDCEIVLENNIVADLLDEYVNDTNIPCKNLVYLYLGEGVGGSIICNSEVLVGNQGMAAKMAHLLIEPNGKLCTCGKKGHLEAYASKSALEEEYTSKKPEVLESQISVAYICEQANQGEVEALEVIDNLLDKLAIAIIQLLVVVNPDTVVLSGDIFDYHHNILMKLENKVDDLVFNKKLISIQWVIRPKDNLVIEHSIAKMAIMKSLSISN